jgi:hypothetical protein
MHGRQEKSLEGKGKKGKLRSITGHVNREGEERYISTLFLTSALDLGVGCQGHATAALPPGKRPVIHCIGGWVRPSVSLDGCGKSRPHRYSILGPPIP